jgi:hypothetical protein
MELAYDPRTCALTICVALTEAGSHFTARSMNSRLPPDFKDQ